MLKKLHSILYISQHPSIVNVSLFVPHKRCVHPTLHEDSNAVVRCAVGVTYGFKVEV